MTEERNVGELEEVLGGNGRAPLPDMSRAIWRNSGERTCNQ